MTCSCTQDFSIYFHTFPFSPVSYVCVYIDTVHYLSKLVGAGIMSLPIVSVIPSVWELLLF